MTGPYTSCTADAGEIAKLPHPGLDPKQSVLARVTAETLRWFQGSGVSPSMGNYVVPYIYGRCAFKDMADAIATARDPDHRIYILGWWTVSNTTLDSAPPLLRFDNLLMSVKAQIRGMFHKSLVPGFDNQPMADFLNKLPNGAGLVDQKLPFARLGGAPTGIRGGIHHQKLLVVYGSRGLIGFTGGMDLNNSRVDNSHGGYEPLHDVHFRVTGPAATQLLRVFSERWLDHPDTPALDQSRFGLSLQSASDDFANVRRKAAGDTLIPSCTDNAQRRAALNHAVAIGRTYANLRKFNANESYSFAPSGEETTWALIKNVIANARNFIYIEDQYFVSRRIKQALVAKLQEPQFETLIILVQASTAFEGSANLRDDEFPYLIAARNEIRTDFVAVDPQQRKWRLFALKATANPDRQEWCGSYLHAKTLIADDDCAIIGTANADDRGYSFDTEISACITDDPLGRVGGQRFARDLRINLWHKHLAVPHAQLQDWRNARQIWQRLPPEAMVADASALENSPLLGPKAILRNFGGADQQWREIFDPDADLLK
jgi:phosphatidylserine/phosphatidylglycerophosphate/cardiolipin synthase-like enzyme